MPYDCRQEEAKGRPKAELVVSDSEREQLEAGTRRRKTAQALALRSRIILECASGFDIAKWSLNAFRFAADGVEMA